MSEDIFEEAAAIIAETKANISRNKETPPTPKTGKVISRQEAIKRWVDGSAGALQMLVRMARSSGHGMNSDLLFAVNSRLRQDRIRMLQIGAICADLVSVERNKPTEQNIQKLASDIEHLMFSSLSVTIKANNIKTAEQYGKYVDNVLAAITEYKKEVINDDIIEDSSKVKSLIETIIDEKYLKDDLNTTAKLSESSVDFIETLIDGNNIFIDDNSDAPETSRILAKSGTVALKLTQLLASYHKGYLELIDRELTDYEKFLKKLNAENA